MEKLIKIGAKRLSSGLQCCLELWDALGRRTAVDGGGHEVSTAQMMTIALSRPERRLPGCRRPIEKGTTSFACAARPFAS